MPEDQTRSTPATPESSAGSATETHGANTNLSPDLQGGPVAGADQAATQSVVQRQSGAPEADAPAPDSPQAAVQNADVSG